MEVVVPEGSLLAGECETAVDLGSIHRVPLKPVSTANPPISAIPQETKKTESYPQVSAIQPLGRAPRLLEAASVTEMVAIKVAFLSGGAIVPMYPRPGPKSAERATPQNKKTRKMTVILLLKIKQSTISPQTVVPMISGSLNPILSATQP